MVWCWAPTLRSLGQVSSRAGPLMAPMDSSIDLGFPLWIRLSHLFNILFITLLIRSGIEILAAHPKLYLNEDCTPGTEWIRFTPRQMPKDQFWTGKDEQEAYSSWVSLPGGKHLGLARQWH